jgi:hypothetical protein
VNLRDYFPAKPNGLEGALLRQRLSSLAQEPKSVLHKTFGYYKPKDPKAFISRQIAKPVWKESSIIS